MPEVHVVHPGGVLQCTTYLLAAPGGSALVDPGSGIAEERVLEGIRRAGADPADIRYVLLTHCHVDHARGAYRFRERGAKLVASPRTADILRAGGHQVWYEYPDEVVPTAVDLTPADGDRLDLCGLDVQVPAGRAARASPSPPPSRASTSCSHSPRAAPSGATDPSKGRPASGWTAPARSAAPANGSSTPSRTRSTDSPAPDRREPAEHNTAQGALP